MGLYLCIFEGDEELDGVEIGSYTDFGTFREAVMQLEDGPYGSKYPTLLLHSDCDGEWIVEQCVELEKELLAISEAFQHLPAASYPAVSWQKEVTKLLGLRPKNLYETFIDVDGEPLIERMIRLCQLAQERNQPILFQ